MFLVTAAEPARLLPTLGQQPVKIVCLGDSVTGVYYHTAADARYPEFLGIALERLYPGHTTTVIMRAHAAIAPRTGSTDSTAMCCRSNPSGDDQLRTQRRGASSTRHLRAELASAGRALSHGENNCRALYSQHGRRHRQSTNCENPRVLRPRSARRTRNRLGRVRSVAIGEASRSAIRGRGD